MAEGRMVTVTSVTDPMTARILAARLGAEGIVWQLRGDDGVYPLGPVELMVEEGDAATARALLGEESPDDVEWRVSSARWRRRRLVIAAVLVALLVTLTFGRFVVEAAFEPPPPEEAPGARNG
jgi:Putative prokaryotic signal transducing protein